ncbi:Pentatricopeptide repeat [Macleaya cordata]|uniref:Pentatricopeptide repeat n=1 Tax=Macleaya cordata TaxID=56857 RepID=A0A200QSE5_MACCD|nr:Pentatricopeptide repeat [Macleaya cordata]
MGYALLLFDEIPHPNVISWNLMISGYNQSSQYENSWKVFCKMHSSGFEPNQFTYGSVLSSCAAIRALKCGKQVYSLVVKNGFFSNGYVRTGMIDLFAKSCFLKEALKVFQDVPCENVVCWNAIISAAVKNKENWVALDLFHQMITGNLLPNGFTISSILTACTALRELEMGRGVHGWFIKCGVEEDVFVGTAIVDLYAKCGDIDEAVKKFSRLKIRNVVSWTAIISGFVQKEDSIYALQFFKEMRTSGVEINNYTITSVVTACAKAAMVKEAAQIHSWILKSGFSSEPTVMDSLINMYSKIGEITLSELLFGEIGSAKNVGTWAVMISGFAQNQRSGRTTELFQRMFQEGLRPDAFCSSSVLSIVDCLRSGTQIHCYIFKAGLVSDVSVGSALSTMYSKCGSLEEAYEVFDEIQGKDEVSWTSMIAGFSEHGFAGQAFQLLQEMMHEEIRPDQKTLSAILTACCAVQSLRKGKEVHGYAIRVGVGREILVGSTLVTMYSKCKSLVSARRVLELMPQKEHISFSSLISGYAQNGFDEDALLLFHEMLVAGLEIDSFTVSSLLGMSANLSNSSLGMQLHTQIVKSGLSSDLSVVSSLVTMYSKCGSIDASRKVFDQIEKPDMITLTAMIVGYAQHGKGMEALKVYELMKEKGIKPDSVTFVGVLSACSHNGLVEEGYFHLNSMTRDYGIEPGPRHYACMVDLLGRSGRLKDAKFFIDNMPIKPDSLVWGTLLAACKIHGDVELGRVAAKRVLELEACDAGAYVSLSNIFADVGQWEEVLNIRNLMNVAGVNKEPGWSSM